MRLKTPVATATQRAEAIGRVVWEYYRKRASTAVSNAVANGLLPCLRITPTPCVHCGKHAAIYEHRDYTEPLRVVPTCDSCNHLAGAAALDPASVIAHIVTGITFGQAKTAHASELGSIRTPKKAVSSAINGLKGGRPISRCPHDKQPSRCTVCRARD